MKTNKYRISYTFFMAIGLYSCTEQRDTMPNPIRQFASQVLSSTSEAESSNANFLGAIGINSIDLQPNGSINFIRATDTIKAEILSKNADGQLVLVNATQDSAYVMEDNIPTKTFSLHRGTSVANLKTGNYTSSQIIYSDQSADTTAIISSQIQPYQMAILVAEAIRLGTTHPNKPSPGLSTNHFMRLSEGVSSQSIWDAMKRLCGGRKVVVDSWIKTTTGWFGYGDRVTEVNFHCE